MCDLDLAFLLTCPSNPCSNWPLLRFRGRRKGTSWSRTPKLAEDCFTQDHCGFKGNSFFAACLVLNKLQYKPMGKAIWLTKSLCHASNVLDETEGLGIDGPKVLEAC